MKPRLKSISKTFYHVMKIWQINVDILLSLFHLVHKSVSYVPILFTKEVHYGTVNKKIIKRRIKKIQMKTVKKGNNSEKLKIWLHFMHGLVLIVIIIMQKTNCQGIDIFVDDLKNPSFNLCSYLTPVKSIVIIKSMNLVNILAVKFYVILEVVLLVKSRFL